MLRWVTVGDGATVRIGAAGIGRGLALAAGLLAAGTAIAWSEGIKQTYAVALTVSAALAILYTAVAYRDATLVADDDGLTISVRGKRTLHPWSGLLEVGWIGPNWPYHGPGIVTRPAAGGPWDTPGPNNPTQLATLAVFGRPGQRRARAALRDQCERHGVPFADSGRQMMLDGPPGSAYRNAPRPARRARP